MSNSRTFGCLKTNISIDGLKSRTRLFLEVYHLVEVKRSPYFKRITGFFLLMPYAPRLFSLYDTTKMALLGWKPMHWPFSGSIFAACTFNFGRVMTCSHLDFGNLAWGWCSITALGLFDPDRGGHLILWDLRLVIRFPPGSTIFIPSAVVRHSNTAIQPHESRNSFTQYTAGGLFRWVDNGFMTDNNFLRTASPERKAQRAAAMQSRWEFGLSHFLTLEELGMQL
ncbi:hypothetical protein GGX14DRAFT_571899 [Mycena pura]|uniref:Uncharacterized protein n=1 Tax=Mycena pura TaxID=153505 RepID=A0AAD6V692_9AGAR|nr:hypothetical protein GGX14DRAFT_571899 [Mycena pura]